MTTVVANRKVNEELTEDGKATVTLTMLSDKLATSHNGANKEVSKVHTGKNYLLGVAGTATLLPAVKVVVSEFDDFMPMDYEGQYRVLRTIMKRMQDFGYMAKDDKDTNRNSSIVVATCLSTYLIQGHYIYAMGEEQSIGSGRPRYETIMTALKALPKDIFKEGAGALDIETAFKLAVEQDPSSDGMEINRLVLRVPSDAIEDFNSTEKNYEFDYCIELEKAKESEAKEEGELDWEEERAG